MLFASTLVGIMAWRHDAAAAHFFADGEVLCTFHLAGDAVSNAKHTENPTFCAHAKHQMLSMPLHGDPHFWRTPQEQRHETQTEKSKPTMVKQEEGQEET